MIDIKDKKDCSGCYACVNICPFDCISMQIDDEGFWYPKVDKDICTECGLCRKACHVINQNIAKAEPKAYAVYNKDEKIRMESSSGGVFTNLASYVLKNGGVVFGAMFNQDYSVSHGFIETYEELYKMRTSKYVQSNIGNSMEMAKKFLIQGRYVLFTGTPCQITGFKLFLSQAYDNLFLCDIICHGVPSPKVWQKYRNLVGKDAERINFRDKTKGWRNFGLRFDFKHKNKLRTQDDDRYLYAFFRNISLRPSCYSCTEKNMTNHSDITLGDYWGIEREHPEFSDDKGISLLITQTPKGERLLSEVRSEIEIIDSNMDMVPKYNLAYTHSPKKPKARQEFFDKLDTYDFKELLDEYCKDPFRVRMRMKKEANIIKIKTIIKKIIGYKRKG